MSEFFEEGRLIDKDEHQLPPPGEEIESFIGRDAFAMPIVRLVEALSDEIEGNLSKMAARIYPEGPGQLRSFYRTTRMVCLEKGRTLKGLQELEAMLGDVSRGGHKEWLGIIMNLAQIGANLLAVTILAKVGEDQANENHDSPNWEQATRDGTELEFDGNDGTDIL